jgi:DNA polymerase
MAIYEAFARVSMGWRGGKLKDENPDLYQLAKIQVLGLGYGCGWEKFIEIAAGYEVPLLDEESQKLVTDFRQQNPRIAGEDGIWRKLDDGFRESVGGDFEMALPSGRSMNYRGVLREVRMKRNAKTKKIEPRFVYTAQIGDKRKELYGGLLTENLVQATARDVFGTHLLALEGNVGDVVFSIHDEAVMEVDNDVTTRDVEQVMSVCPDWLEGCPVGAEAKEAAHYLK